MENIQTFDVEEYMRKIKRMESMLQELKQGLFFFNKEFQDSVKRGEKDIKEGNVTICKTESELDNFFISI